MNPKYEFELWINDNQVGDITKLAKTRSFSIKHNDREELTFNLDVKAFEAYCESIGSQPVEVLEAYVTDVRVKRNGSYLFGVQVVDMEYTFAESGAQVVVRCSGFLDLMMDRYVTINYTQTDAAGIARDLIAETQAVMGSFGIGNGVSQDAGVLRDRTYVDQNVKDAIINLTNLSDGNFDFKFLADRTFETYLDMGTTHTGIKFTYPYNVKSLTVPRTALNLYNYIIALGSGFGEETLRSEAGDTASRLNYGTRQKILSYNSISDQDTLAQQAVSDVLLRKDVLILPKLKVSGEFCDLNTVWVGDRVPVETQGYASMPLNGLYRIEQITCALDDNDAEDIDLIVDNYGI